MTMGMPSMGVNLPVGSSPHSNLMSTGLLSAGYRTFSRCTTFLLIRSALLILGAALVVLSPLIDSNFLSDIALPRVIYGFLIAWLPNDHTMHPGKRQGSKRTGSYER